MRILMISHTNLTWTPDYARHFAARGDEVCVVSFSPEPISGVRTVFVGVEPFNKYANKRLFVTRVPRIRRIVAEFTPDVVFATYVISNGLSAALSWSGPLVLDAVGGDVRDLHPPGDWRNAARRFVLRRVCERATAVHAWSEDLARQLTHLGVSADKIVHWPMGVDVDAFRPPDRPAGGERIICIRKHEPIYDIPTIIEALARLKGAGREFDCALVGGGHLLDAHRAKAATCGLADRVHFLGPTPREAIPALLSAAGTYVSASHADGTSSSLLEAMASGLLPVVTRIPANTTWIEDSRNGLLFDCGRADQLAAALERAMSDRELRRRAIAENRERVVRDGDLRRNLDRMRAVLESAAAGARRGAA
jgi:glycosyltransferase involved in cell wall biosynthesis